MSVETIMDPIRELAYGIHAIDTRYVRPGLDASHLIVRDGSAAFIDSGSNRSVPFLLAALDQLHISPARVRYVIATHVHLDHAGGVGKLIEYLPNAKVIVHPIGAPHLESPERLEAATRSVYGDQVFDTLYGSLVPVPKDRLLTVEDGEQMVLGKSALRFLFTPGHALHHVSIFDSESCGLFSGDAFGISYRIFDSPDGRPFIFPSTSPTQFDPNQMHASIERIQSLNPSAIYLTHYSHVSGVAALATDLHNDVDKFVEIAEQCLQSGAGERRIQQELHNYLCERLLKHGSHATAQSRETWLAMDTKLNASGLLAWWARKEKGKHGK